MLTGNTIFNTIYTQGVSDNLGFAVGAPVDSTKGLYVLKTLLNASGTGINTNLTASITSNFSGVVRGNHTILTGSGANNFTTSFPGALIGQQIHTEKAGSGTAAVVTGFYSQITSSGGGTVTAAYGAVIDSALSPGSSITSNVGLLINEQTVGTNNTNLLLGTATPPSGNFSIYNASSYESYFASAVAFNNLTANRVVYADASKRLQTVATTANGAVYGHATTGIASTAALTNGQLLIGQTGGTPLAATLTGTAGQIDVTNGAGTITLDFPDMILLPVTGITGGIRIGGDVDLYRSAANILTIPDTVYVTPPTNTTTSGNVYGLQVTHVGNPASATSGRTFALQFTATASGNQNYTDSTAGVTGVEGAVNHTGSGTITRMIAAMFYGTSSSTGTITEMTHCYALGYDVSSGATVTTWNGYRADFPRASGAGLVTTAYGFVTHPRTVSGAHITNMIGLGIFPNANMNAHSANGQVRLGIDIAAMPSPGAFTGTTTAAIRIQGTNGSRDAILFSDVRLYRNTTTTLYCDQKFETASLKVGTTSVAGQALTASDTAGNVAFTTIVNKHQVNICFCAGFTPAGTGADVAEFTIPYSPADGTTSMTWRVRRIDFRVNVAGGAPAITLEKYTGTGAFSATTIGTVTLGSGAYEGNKTSSFTTSTLTSGDKVRFNVGTLGTATGWTIQLMLEAV